MTTALRLLLCLAVGAAVDALNNSNSEGNIAELPLSQLLDRIHPPLTKDEYLCNCTIDAPYNQCGIDGLDGSQSICRTGTHGACYKWVSRKKNDMHVPHYGCYRSDKLVPRANPIQCNQHRDAKHLSNVVCCYRSSGYHFCNQNLSVELSDNGSSSGDKSEIVQKQEVSRTNYGQLSMIAIGIIICCLMVLVGFLIIRFRVFFPVRMSVQSQSTFHKTSESLRLLGVSTLGDAGGLPKTRVAVNGDVSQLESMLKQIEMSVQSGSGAGLPLMVQRSIARQITLHHAVGSGRFGQVFLGEWMGEAVAVKVFSSRDEKSWFREVEIYNSTMLIHPNILRFIAADNFDHGAYTELWLVTEYIANGSLFDFLTLNTISGVQLLAMARSLCNGLQHLHAEIGGTCCKAAIAHRDVKSKNVLVKANGDCVIADLGLAVKYQSGTLNLPENAKVGTVRYLAPELLDGTFNPQDFDSYKMADIYGLGLVIWEMATRTKVDGVYEQYELPYSDTVGADPSEEEMRKAVCTNNRRPLVPNRWHDVPLLREVMVVVKECWRKDPHSRLNALRTKKNIDRICDRRPIAGNDNNSIIIR